MVYTISVITILLYLWLSILAFRRWKEGKAIRRFAFLLLATASWVLVSVFQTYYKVQYPLDAGIQTFLGNIDFALAAAISFSVASFSIHFPKKEKKFSLGKEILSFVPIGILILLSFVGIFFENRIIGEKVEFFSTWHYWYYISFLFLYFIVFGFLIFVRKYFKSEGIEKLQLRYITISYGISILLLLFLSVSNAIKDFPDIYDLWLTNAAVLFVSGSAYAILKYRLLGIRFLIRRGFINFLTLAFLLGFYLIFFFILRGVLGDRELITTPSVLITIVVIVFTMPFLYPRALRIIRYIVQPSEEVSRERIRARVRNIAKKIDYQVLFQSLLENVKEHITVPSIRGLTLEADNGYHEQFPEKKNGRAFFKRDHALIDYFRKVDGVLVRQEFPYLLERASREAKKQFAEIGKVLDNLDAEIAVLIGSQEVAPVVALLPSKRDNSAFTKEEIEFLRSIAIDMSQSFENFFLYRHALRRAGVEV